MTLLSFAPRLRRGTVSYPVFFQFCGACDSWGV